ncbi:hypothetical protein F3Y22_tig00110384pilonHSYRG00381 [Hibiscus syriacus]|uniref:Uncharacterized protein n=1 Tax=Hibiscus syriacus TaxID=106335 RepID=A0A6A3ARS9_HIBSY|nr:hypothetical protein F3Y22_tig00110384pilonHSYRG00381 [Hibiscus syriacus]
MNEEEVIPPLLPVLIKENNGGEVFLNAAESKERLLSRTGYRDQAHMTRPPPGDGVKGRCFRSCCDSIEYCWNGLQELAVIYMKWVNRILEQHSVKVSTDPLGHFAGVVGLGIAELSIMSGEYEEYVILISISYCKLYPQVKTMNMPFGCFVDILYRAGVWEQLEKFYPHRWEDLHKSVVKISRTWLLPWKGVLKDICNVEYERIPSKILTYQAYDDPLYSAYRSVVQSSSQEDTLLDFASWEPPHGRYRSLNYPWRNFVKVSGALRHCAFMVMAMHGCMLSEIQAPRRREKFLLWRCRGLVRGGYSSAREVVSSSQFRTWALSPHHKDLEEEAKEDEHKKPSWPRLSVTAEALVQPAQESKIYESASSLSLATFASLLIEFIARLQNLVNAFEELSEKAISRIPATNHFRRRRMDVGAD